MRACVYVFVCAFSGDCMHIRFWQYYNNDRSGKKASVYDQEKPQSHIADQSTASLGRVTEH